MIAIVPALLAVIGVLVYALASNTKLVEIGRIMFACAFLVMMLHAASKVVKLF